MGMRHWGECQSRDGGECICGFEERKAAWDARDHQKLAEITARCEAPILDRYCTACDGQGATGGGQRSKQGANGVTFYFYEPAERCPECNGSGLARRTGEGR